MKNCDQITSILDENECDSFKSIFLKNTPTLSNLGDKCYGIDINNTASYLWFKKKFLSRINKYFDVELKLVHAFYASFTKPFSVHRDLKPIPNNTKGVPYISCVIPISVNNDKDLCHLASTIIFKEGKNDNAKLDHLEYLSHCELNQLENRQIDKIFKWKPYDMIWWKSELYHCSSHFKNFNSKECFVIHTYVE